MPSNVKDIRELVDLASAKHVKTIVVKKNGSETKFKLRGSRFVYTLAVNDQERAKKIVSSLSPGIKVIEISSKAPKKASAF